MQSLSTSKSVPLRQSVLLIWPFLFVVAFAAGQTTVSPHKEAPMTAHATGPFDVKVNPQDDKPEDPLLNRMTLDKHYHGDMEASAQGQMLTAGTAVKGSGAYVAIEKVTGSLNGRTGTFVLQHSG